MSTQEQLQWEARMRPRYAGVASLAAATLVIAAAIQVSGDHAKVQELTVDLIVAAHRDPLDTIGAVINGIGLIAVAVTLNFLFLLIKARRPTVQQIFRVTAIVGGVVAAITGVLYAVVIAAKAHTFVTTGDQTYQEAKNLTSGTGLEALPLIGQFASLLLAAGLIFMSLNAMRVGLLTRMMGYLGIFTGVLLVIPIGSPVPIVQAFWLIALAYLFSGHWPSGVPPSWSTGVAEPWPSSAELRQQRLAARGALNGRGAPAPAPEAVAAAPTRVRANTSKRKRKRRH